MKTLHLLLTIFCLVLICTAAYDAWACTCSPTIVVIMGSSTDQLNPTVPGYATLYQEKIQTSNPNNTLYELANANQTICSMIPSGSTLPGTCAPTCQLGPLPNINITKALSYNPTEIFLGGSYGTDIHNCGTTATDVETALNMITTAANSANVPIFLFTPHPRNSNAGSANYTSSDITALLNVVSYIETNYGSKAIPIWTQLSNPANTLSLAYDDGSGEHLNAAGQMIVYDQLLASNPQ